MFEHSVRVPRQYKIAANIFKKVSIEGGSVKTLLYDNKLRHFRTNVLYALITETIKHSAALDKIFTHCGLLEKESRLDPWLAKVLTTELLFGKKALPGQSKPEQTILTFREQFEKYTSNNQDEVKVEATPRPRYVRINTNLLTTSDAIRAFQDEGYRFVRCTSGSYDDYLNQIQGLTEEDFTQDYHVKTVFVFASGTKLHDHELYLENKIILQDKATTLAVHLLAPPGGSTVLDLCAAPGMKTTQIAAYLRNDGKVYAVERDEKRYKTLCDFVEKTGSTCVQTFNRDSLDIKRGEMNDVEYILLDPSCSGSGMDLCVHNYVDPTRLAKLTSLQEKFLKHALNAFPNAKRIVYSTCSKFPEENERVITNVVKTSRTKWRVQDVKELLKGNWNNFGSAMYGSIGTRCLYAKPDSDLTTGFFLAVLDRDPKDLEKCRNAKAKEADDDVTSKGDDDKNGDLEEAAEVDEKPKKKKKDKNKDRVEVSNLNETEEVVPKKKKKRKHDLELIETEKIITEKFKEDLEENEMEQIPKKKKKKNKTVVDADVVENNSNTAETVVVTEDVEGTRKKKKKRDKSDEIVEENDVPETKKKKKHKKNIKASLD